MPTELLLKGVPTVIAQTTAYALPARSCFLMTTAAVEISANGTTWVAATNANTTGVQTSASFVRCTTGPTTVIVKN